MAFKDYFITYFGNFIFGKFIFGFFHFSCVIFCTMFSVCKASRARQKWKMNKLLRNIFVTLSPKTTKNQVTKMGWKQHLSRQSARRLHWYSLIILQPSKNSAKIEFVPITKHKLQPYSFCAIRISKTDLSMPQFQKKIQYLSSNNYWTNGNSQPKRKCKVWLLNLIKQSLQQ